MPTLTIWRRLRRPGPALPDGPVEGTPAAPSHFLSLIPVVAGRKAADNADDVLAELIRTELQGSGAPIGQWKKLLGQGHDRQLQVDPQVRREHAGGSQAWPPPGARRSARSCGRAISSRESAMRPRV